MKISLVILTWNRKHAVETTLKNNLSLAGVSIDEIVHVDNGSDPGFTDWFQDEFKPQTQIRHDRNRGVSAGYNRGMALSYGSHILITGIDRLMPKDWLLTLVDHYQAIPTGVVSVYLAGQNHDLSVRYTGPGQCVNGKHIQPSVAFEAKLMSREFLLKCGFFREDFNTYGYEDNEWMMRAERVARELGVINYIIPGLEAQIFQGNDLQFKTPNGMLYQQYKHSFVENNGKILEEIRKLDYPYYNPYNAV